MFNLNYIVPTKEENGILYRLNPSYVQYSEMSIAEREFLNALILRVSPKKALEIGVSGGASSVLMANALKEAEGKLYSIDTSKTYYRDQSKPCGFIMEEYPDLKNNHKQYLGGIAYNFMDEIGNGVDFAFLDTAHVFPGELLDFLMIYPYLSPGATVVFHDTSINLSLDGSFEKAVVTGTLCSAITGEKYQPVLDYDKYKENASPGIIAIKFTPETGQRLWEVFNLLVHTWEYPISKKDFMLLVRHFEKWYPQEAVEFFKRINDFQNYNFYRIQKRILLPRWLGLLITCFIYRRKNRKRFREKYVKDKRLFFELPRFPRY